MHQRKSDRHAAAADARWRAAAARADAERSAGIEDRQAPMDRRQPTDLDLSSAGGRRYRIEPRLGYVAWRAVDADTGRVIHCAALKTLLRRIADELPRMAAARRLR